MRKKFSIQLGEVDFVDSALTIEEEDIPMKMIKMTIDETGPQKYGIFAKSRFRFRFYRGYIKTFKREDELQHQIDEKQHRHVHNADGSIRLLKMEGESNAGQTTPSSDSGNNGRTNTEIHEGW